ncbi:hypothetical protein D770_17240 [Flammeovirgaceae bacterium 311]|nr:hypothetical protein D770_17240 [Flammeovirgaceae bacterium 311]
MSIFLLLMLACAALAFLVMGWLLRYRQRLELMAGYNPKVTINKKGLARWAGNTYMGMAPLQVVCVLLALKTGLLLVGCLAYIAVSCIGMIVLALGATQYSNLN